ncbi:MAG: hypothetical protein D6781_13885 [Verrucomicrobia bacterium]|nr:MAG: hypothetical protein D6781_13885 [Verrucomicrobiota bacterium]
MQVWSYASCFDTRRLPLEQNYSNPVNRGWKKTPPGDRPYCRTGKSMRNARMKHQLPAARLTRTSTTRMPVTDSAIWGANTQ